MPNIKPSKTCFIAFTKITSAFYSRLKIIQDCYKRKINLTYFESWKNLTQNLVATKNVYTN